MRVAVTAMMLAACGSGSPAGDAGGEADGSTTDPPPAHVPPATPAPPELPAPAVIPPCPDGWVEMPSEGDGWATTCEPWSDPAPATCPPGSALRPGDPGCTAVGADCPAGAFRTDVPPGDVRYVQSGAPAGGDGSLTSPFATIDEALAGATPANTVVLGVGTYATPGSLPVGVTLLGSCVEQTRIGAGIVVAVADVTIRDLTVAGDAEGIVVQAGGVLTLSGVLVEGALGTGVRVLGSLMAQDVAIVDTRPDPADGATRGVLVESGGNTALTRAFVLAGGSAGLVVTGMGSRATLTSVSVRAASAPATNGVSVIRGGLLVATQSVFEGAAQSAVRASGEGSRLELTRCVVRGAGLAGLLVGEGASADASRVLSVGNLVGMAAQLDGSTLELVDVVSRDNGAEPPDARSHGVTVGSGMMNDRSPHLSATRISVEGNAFVGLSVGAGATAHVRDATVLDTRPVGAAVSGPGIFVADGNLVIERASLERNTAAGILVNNAGTQVRVVDVTVRDTGAYMMGVGGSSRGGAGIHNQFSSKLVVERALLENNTGFGLVTVSGEAFAVASDVTARGTRSTPDGQLLGIGVGVAAMAEGILDLERAHAEANHGWGMFFTEESVVRVRDIVASDNESFEHPRARQLGGRGFEAQSGADVEVVRGLFERNRDAGLVASSGDGSDRPPTRLVVRDAIVRDGRADTESAREGRGLVLYGAAEVEVDNATFERCRDVTLSAYRPGARLSMRRVAVVDTLAVECAETTCSDTPAGIGVGSYREAEVRLEAFVVQGSFLAGVQVVGGQMDLRNGVVSGSPIGANVQSPGYDLSRLTDDVAYRDNGVNLDATSLPVPAPGMVREVVGSDI